MLKTLKSIWDGLTSRGPQPPMPTDEDELGKAVLSRPEPERLGEPGV